MLLNYNIGEGYGDFMEKRNINVSSAYKKIFKTIPYKMDANKYCNEIQFF